MVYPGGFSARHDDKLQTAEVDNDDDLLAAH